MNNNMSRSVEKILKSLVRSADYEAVVIGETVVNYYGELTGALLDKGYCKGLIEMGICRFARKVMEKAQESDDQIIDEYTVDNLVEILTICITNGLAEGERCDEAA